MVTVLPLRSCWSSCCSCSACRSRSRSPAPACSASSWSPATSPGARASSASRPFSTVADYALTTIPMFILMAYFSASSGLARDLYTAATTWLSHIKGGLAIATVFACGIFGAMSGASVAAASVMSKIAMPEMRRHGYSEELGAGAIGSRRHARHSHPAQHRDGDLRHRHPDLDRQAADRRRVPGIIVGILLAVMIYLWVRGEPAHAPHNLSGAAARALGEPRAASGRACS